MLQIQRSSGEVGARLPRKIFGSLMVEEKASRRRDHKVKVNKKTCVLRRVEVGSTWKCARIFFGAM